MLENDDKKVFPWTRWPRVDSNPRPPDVEQREFRIWYPGIFGATHGRFPSVNSCFTQHEPGIAGSNPGLSHEFMHVFFLEILQVTLLCQNEITFFAQ